MPAPQGPPNFLCYFANTFCLLAAEYLGLLSIQLAHLHASAHPLPGMFFLSFYQHWFSVVVQSPTHIYLSTEILKSDAHWYFYSIVRTHHVVLYLSDDKFIFLDQHILDHGTVHQWCICMGHTAFWSLVLCIVGQIKMGGIVGRILNLSSFIFLKNKSFANIPTFICVINDLQQTLHLILKSEVLQRCVHSSNP